MSVLLSGRVAMKLPMELLSLPKLPEVPPRTQWLVIKGMYHTRSEGFPSSVSMSDLLVYGECLGVFAMPFSDAEYAQCLILMSGPNKWLGSKGGRSTSTMSQVLIAQEMTNSQFPDTVFQQELITQAEVSTISLLLQNSVTENNSNI